MSEFEISDIMEGNINQHNDISSCSVTSYWTMREEDTDRIL